MFKNNKLYNFLIFSKRPQSGYSLLRALFLFVVSKIILRSKIVVRDKRANSIRLIGYNKDSEYTPIIMYKAKVWLPLKNLNLKNLNLKYLFWSLLILSFLLIVFIKFSPLKNIHTSDINYLSWFPYGMELGDVLYGISISYIVSCIFYFVVVYLPEQKKRKSAMTIIEKRLDNISGDIGVVIAYYLRKNDIIESDNAHLKEEVESITDFDYDRVMNFNYQYVEKQTGNKVPFGTGNYTEEMLVYEYKNQVQKRIESIFQIPIILNVDHSLIVTLEEIYNSSFWGISTTRIHMKENHPQIDLSMYEMVTPDLGKDLYKLYLLNKELSKYFIPRKYTFEQRED